MVLKFASSNCHVEIEPKIQLISTKTLTEFWMLEAWSWFLDETFNWLYLLKYWELSNGSKCKLGLEGLRLGATLELGGVRKCKSTKFT